VQQRPDDAGDTLDLWWPRPPRPLDPSQHVQQVRELVERRRATIREREQTVEQVVRGLAQRSVTAAPSSFTEGVRRSLLYVSIAPVPVPNATTARWQPLATGMVRSLRLLPLRRNLSIQQRRAALGGAGTMALVLVVGGLSMAVAPAEMLTLLGLASALIFSTAALGHMLSTAMSAIMGTTVLAAGACILFAALAVVWVRLVRQPMEV
jgi:hypothetical protein